MPKQITIYREDMNNSLHGNLFNSLLTDLGVQTHTIVAGREVDREIDHVILTVTQILESD